MADNTEASFRHRQRRTRVKMGSDGITQLVSALLDQPYTRIIVRDPEGGFSAEVLELPGCYSSGATAEEAASNLSVAMEMWFESELQEGRAIPDASPAADSERTRLEARLAEVEAERDTWRGLAERAEPVIEAMLSARHEQEAALDALRAAVRPLVEALRAVRGCNDIGLDGSMGCTHCYETARAALADPAIAALLDQQKEQG